MITIPLVLPRGKKGKFVIFGGILHPEKLKNGQKLKKTEKIPKSKT